MNKEYKDRLLSNVLDINMSLMEASHDFMRTILDRGVVDSHFEFKIELLSMNMHLNLHMLGYGDKEIAENILFYKQMGFSLAFGSVMETKGFESVRKNYMEVLGNPSDESLKHIKRITDPIMDRYIGIFGIRSLKMH
ncbi:hypothetical protein KO465_00925 [Candidatus Micrarchaeota archaeon]|nr:hypothetical protein [Candidatus Micrarchaeota archaeon]